MKMFEYIKNANNIYIVSHIRPDGDAIGSSIALLHAIWDMGKNVHILMSTYSERFNFLEELKGVLPCVKEEMFDLLICVDCSDVKRLDMPEEDIAKAKNIIVFDHHKFSSIECAAKLVDEVSPANCEIIYRFLKENDIVITPKIANAIYLGLMTDTGSFNYARTTAATYKIAAEMIECGADFVNICKSVNDTVPEGKAYLIAYTLENMRSYYGGKLRVAVANKEILDKLNVDREDAEGMTNYLRMVKGTMLAVYARQTDEGDFKVSLRSEGDIDSSVIAQTFGGGGHIKAAGFSTSNVEKMEQDIVEMMKDVLE